MSAGTTIEWTEFTWNPTTGCDRLSPGCDNCYALRLAKRLKRMGSARYQLDGDPRTSGPGFAVTLHEDRLDTPKRLRDGRVIFVNSMSDLFHPDVPLEFIVRVFETMAETPRHTYQVLTKRSQRLSRVASSLPWPDSVWMGVSVESSAFTFRINHLRATPAKVKFVSAEPLIAPLGVVDLTGIHWLIAGGESGVGARPVHVDWLRELRDQARSAGVPFFFKQWGGRTSKSGGRMLDGELLHATPVEASNAASR